MSGVPVKPQDDMLVKVTSSNTITGSAYELDEVKNYVPFLSLSQAEQDHVHLCYELTEPLEEVLVNASAIVTWKGGMFVPMPMRRYGRGYVNASYQKNPPNRYGF